MELKISEDKKQDCVLVADRSLSSKIFCRFPGSRWEKNSFVIPRKYHDALVAYVKKHQKDANKEDRQDPRGRPGDRERKDHHKCRDDSDDDHNSDDEVPSKSDNEEEEDEDEDEDKVETEDHHGRSDDDDEEDEESDDSREARKDKKLYHRATSPDRRMKDYQNRGKKSKEDHDDEDKDEIHSPDEDTISLARRMREISNRLSELEARQHQEEPKPKSKVVRDSKPIAAAPARIENKNTQHKNKK